VGDDPGEMWTGCLHIRIVWPAAAFRRNPVDVLRGILDVAGFAMHAVLRIDDEARIASRFLVSVDDLIDPGGTIEPRRLAIDGEVALDRNRRIGQLEMNRLVFLVIGVRDEDRGELVESRLLRELLIIDRRYFRERLEAGVIGLAMFQRAEEREAENDNTGYIRSVF
jgi:hypothetical protein